MVSVLGAGILADIGWRLPFLIYLFAFVILPGAVFSINEPQVQAGPRGQDAGDEKASLPLKTVALIFI